MSKIRRLVLDVLKPHEPETLEFAERASEEDGVEGVNVTLVENEKDVENIKMTVEGEEMDFKSLKQVIEDLGGSIHGIDQAACGEKLIEEVKTPQD